MISIREWMDGKTVLITGGSGFFGKVLTEKLLRTCLGVKRIYIIIRPKRGKTAHERWAEIQKDALFEPLLTETPDIIERKVTVLEGNMTLINLGLSQGTIEELKNTVNVIFHSAATVQFNDPLYNAILGNTRGTYELCKLATEMNNLEVFVHVSTAYCHYNLNKTYYEEKIYEPCQDWRTMLKLLETEDESVVNCFTKKIIQDHPNTYTFSKSLSEKIIEEYSHKFPAVIVRPSVVAGIYRDPLPGWTDNLNGIFGVATAICKGVLRVIRAGSNVILDCVPVDVSINALIASGWEKATSEDKELSIYNCAYADTVTIHFKRQLPEHLALNENECPLDDDIWYPFALLVDNNLYFQFLFFFLQVLPAVLIDSILFLMKKKTRLVKLTITLYHACQALSAFATRNTFFDNSNYKNLWNKLTEGEDEIYIMKPPSNSMQKEIILILHRGVKKYFLKENLEDIEYHKTKLRRLYYLDRVTRGILIGAVLIAVHKLINVAIHSIFGE